MTMLAEWSAELDIALRSVPWTPLSCVEDGAEQRVFLAKFLSSDASPAQSCCLLLFDCESGQSYFEPLRASRILKRCSHIVAADDGSAAGSYSSTAAGGTSQDESDARLAQILTALGHVFDIASTARDSIVFSVQTSRYATVLDIRSKTQLNVGPKISFCFEADTLDHEPASSVFLNHWALPLLGVGSALQHSLLQQNQGSGLLPSFQTSVDASAQAAQQDHCRPILEFFGSPFLATSLTRWSESHLRREQPQAIVTSFAISPAAKAVHSPATESASQPRPHTRTVCDDVRASRTAFERMASHEQFETAGSSVESVGSKHPSTPADDLDLAPTKRPRPSRTSPPLDCTRDRISVLDNSGSPFRNMEPDPDETVSEGGRIQAQHDNHALTSAKSELRTQQVADAPSLSPPQPPSTARSDQASSGTMPPLSGTTGQSAQTSDLSSAAAALSSASKAGPAPVRTVLAPVRKGAGAARGTARNRRF